MVSATKLNGKSTAAAVNTNRLKEILGSGLVTETIIAPKSVAVPPKVYLGESQGSVAP